MPLHYCAEDMPTRILWSRIAFKISSILPRLWFYVPCPFIWSLSRFGQSCEMNSKCRIVGPKSKDPYRRPSRPYGIMASNRGPTRPGSTLKAGVGIWITNCQTVWWRSRTCSKTYNEVSGLMLPLSTHRLLEAALTSQSISWWPNSIVKRDLTDTPTTSML